jgi:hypothetical protein
MSDTPPDPSAVTPPDPPVPAAPGGQLPPPPGDVAGGTPEPSRIRGRTWIFAIGAGLAVLIAVVVAVALTSGPSDELPDGFADVHRLHTAEVQQLEDQLHAIKVGDAKIEVAGYGSNDDATLILFRYSNLPARPSVAAVLRGAGGGIEGAGGTVDLDAETTQVRDGVEYRCLPFSGRLFPGDVSDAHGQICAWLEGDDVAVVMDARTSDLDQAITDSEAAHAALG